jgi:hypothetical protein
VFSSCRHALQAILPQRRRDTKKICSDKHLALLPENDIYSPKTHSAEAIVMFRKDDVMSDAFTKLREFLDQFPIGFPKTPSGVELRILKRLFTEEEAAIAVTLTPIPEEASQIAERAGLDPVELEERRSSAQPLS